MRISVFLDFSKGRLLNQLTFSGSYLPCDFFLSVFSLFPVRRFSMNLHNTYLNQSRIRVHPYVNRRKQAIFLYWILFSIFKLYSRILYYSYSKNKYINRDFGKCKSVKKYICRSFGWFNYFRKYNCRSFGRCISSQIYICRDYGWCISIMKLKYRNNLLCIYWRDKRTFRHRRLLGTWNTD